MRRLRQAFTLIEVLVVVAIIALLISILLPSLNKARQQAKTTVCDSNLHQIGVGLFMYAEQHKGKTLQVWPFRVQPPPVPYTPFLWDYSYQSVLAGGVSVSQQNAVPRQYTGYVGKSKDVFFCPDRPKEAHVVSATAGYGTIPGIATTYSYNETGWSDINFEGYLCDGRSLQSIKPAYDKIWIGDSSNITPEMDGWQLAYSNDGFAGPNPPPYQKLTWKDIYNAPGTKFGYKFVESVRHGKGNNCLFYDGHATTVVQMLGRNWRVNY